MDTPPNVIIILTDDQGWDDVGYNGNTDIRTPVLDALASESVRFDQFITHPVCAPTRASLLTGRHYLRTGVSHVHGGKDYLHPDEVTMAQWFKANGYTTGIWGKWHSGKTTGYLPWERGFDEAYMADLYVHKDGAGLLNGKRIETAGWTTDALTRMCADFITRNQQRPFFALLSHLAPHTPLVAPEELIAPYRALGMSESLATAYAMIEQIDTATGELLNTLDSHGIRDNTLIIYLSDNGPQYLGAERMSPADYQRRYRSGMRGHKGSIWENGIRVPAFASLPSRFQPRKLTRLVDVHDILPTLIDVCGLDQPPQGALPLDGRSMRQYLEGHDNLPDKESVVFAHFGWAPVKGNDFPYPDWQQTEFKPYASEDNQRLPFSSQVIALREEQFKLLRNPDPLPDQPRAVNGEILIHVTADPHETANVIHANPQRADAMRERLTDWFTEVKAGPHAWHIPRFAIGPGTSNLLYLNAPVRQLGNVWNSGIWSHDWREPGDGGVYRIHVTETNAYALQIRSRNLPQTPLVLEFSISGAALLTTAISATPNEQLILQLPKGDHDLTIRRTDSDQPHGTPAPELFFIQFNPI